MLYQRSVLSSLSQKLFITPFYTFSNDLNIQLLYQKHYQKNNLIDGFCTEQGTQEFRKRNQKLHEEYWKKPLFIKQKLELSGLGIGTQSGDPTAETDLKQMQTLIESIKSGCINVIDTDVNFRWGKSEKTINAVLNYLTKDAKMSRQELFITTKVGYLMHDIDSQLDDKAFKKILIDEKIVTQEQIINDIYCLSQGFINFSVEKSRLSLGVETIDLMYLNNPVEALLPVLGKKAMYEKLEKAFHALEELRSMNKIRFYGLASFVSFRSPSTEEGIHGELTEIVELARKIGGEKHGLRFCLIPFNLGMPESILSWQKSRNSSTNCNVFEAAKQNQLNINLCCPLFQGRLIKVPFQSKLLDGIKNNSAKHLQLVRSMNYPNLVTTVFGSLSKEHVRENMEIGQQRLLTPEEWDQILPIPKQ